MENEYEQKANEFLVKHQMIFSAMRGVEKCPLFCDGKHMHGEHYRVYFRRKGQAPGHRLSFWNSMNDVTEGNTPSAYDVITCLAKSDPGDFEEFCGNYGYDTDSRKAEKTYKAVVAEWKNVEAFFSEEELAEMGEIN
jgi:hypothetical protein